MTYQRFRSMWIIFILVILIMTGCSPDQSNHENIHVENYIEYEINIYSIEKKLITSYKALQYDNMQYLRIDDFIHLCNLINQELKMIQDLSTNNYDDINHELAVTYRADANFKGEIISELIFNNLKLENRVISGEDTRQMIRFNDGLLSKISTDQTIYLPLEAIRTLIFKNDLYLLKTNPSEFTLLGKSSLNMSINLEKAREMVEVDLTLLNKSLQQFGYLDSKVIDSSYVEDYSHYYYELLKLVDYRNDYHSNVIPISEVSRERLSELGFDSFRETSNFQKFFNTFDDSLPESMKWEQLNPTTLYVNVDSFSIDVYAFKSLLNRLRIELAENKSIDSVIIDLRNNTGGFSRNAFGLLSVFIGEKFYLNLGYFGNHELISTQHYEFSKSNSSNSYRYKLTILVNESSASASLLFASLLKDNVEVNIMGSEPLFKRTLQIVFFQLMDGTILSESSREYKLMNRSGEVFDDIRLVDEQMDDESVLSWLEALRNK